MAVANLAHPHLPPPVPPLPLPACPPPHTHLRGHQNFEHLTQAATGATTGEWLVNFCAYRHGTCKDIDVLWRGLAAKLQEAVEENPDGPRINVATVDIDKYPWLKKRFQVQHTPTVLLFRHGWLHLFNQQIHVHVSRQKDMVKKIIRFVERGWSSAPSMPVPPEPHVPTEHELSFNYFVGGTCVLCALCFLVDLVLQKRNRKALEKFQEDARSKGKAAAKEESKTD